MKNKFLTIFILLILFAVGGLFFKKSIFTKTDPAKPPSPSSATQPQNDSPRIVSTKPDPLEEAIVPADQVVEITFNRSLENSGEFKLRIEPKIEVKIQLSQDRKTAKIIPEKFETRAVVETEGLLKAIKLAAVFSKNEANVVVVTVGSKTLSLKSSAKEVGSQENEVEAQVEGGELTVAFNTKFLQDVLSAGGAKQTIIEFSGSLSACLIKPVGIEGLEYIIMPVRLS